MKRLVALLVLTGCCSMCPERIKIVEVKIPVPVPCPTPPPVAAPLLPALSPEAPDAETVRVLIEAILTLQGYNEELRVLLDAYRGAPQ